MADNPKIVHIVAFSDVQVLDVCGPLQVFASANRRLGSLGKPQPYAMKVVAPEPGSVMSSAGLGLLTEPLPADEPCDTLIIAGGRGIGVAMENSELVAWIQHQSATARRVTSVCSGAFLLAQTGLLDNRRVVTHWDSCDSLAKRFPRLRVDPDPIFINDGHFWTSAGVTAGIDLALALIEEDLGHTLALAVARDLVVFLKRPGGQAQFSNALSMQHASHPTENRFIELHGWLLENLNGDLSVANLAARVGMSERSFVRHYSAQTGNTPAKAVERLRVEAARRLLSESTLAIKRVASQCGFGSEETLRRSFLRAMSITPQAYRERFRH